MIYEKVKDLEAENERLKIENDNLKELVDLPRPKECSSCKHYVQHYVKSGNSYGKTYAGHCKHGNRTKDRKPDATCNYYERW